MSRTAATTLVRRLPPATLIVGKGGVGKTTAAAALALEASRSLGRTLILTSDPARALPAVLGVPLHAGLDASPVPYAPRLVARVLDAGVLRARFMERWGPAITVILDRGTYLDDADIAPLVDTAMPGSDEIFAALELAEILTPPAGDGFARIVIDTAPTGHTLRLLQLPRTFRALVRLLDAMQAKHRLMVRALTRGYRPDQADTFLDEMKRRVDALDAALGDPARCAAVMITRSAALVREETDRYVAALNRLGVHLVAMIWNASDEAPDTRGAVRHYVVPRLDDTPVGEHGLDRWLVNLRPAKPAARPRARSTGARKPTTGGTGRAAGTPVRLLDSLVRPLTIVAGKGGVGKTTVAAALALHCARTARTLIVSTDPAPSLADAFVQQIVDEETPITGVASLRARQMDASAAFARLRDRYQARVDALFEGLAGRGLDLVHDRAIIRDLLALAPPGIDEVYALSLLSDALFEGNHEKVIVDPAPTGHLLRLLEMPETALTWSHQLMRLMLKYREIGGLGDTAADVLAFARNLRALDALLSDSRRTGIVIVTLDEPVVAGETARLAGEIVERHIGVTGIVLNRLDAGRAATFPMPDAPVHLGAPLRNPPPIGPAQLTEWSQTWVPLKP